MITIILIKKIASLFLVMLAGAILVKTRLLKPEDSRIFSVCLLYLMFPCMIISSYQIDYDPAVKDGLLLSIIASIGVHILLFILVAILSKPLHLSSVEQATCIYSNAGNLIIPLVIAMLGPEWVIYCSGFIVVQMFLLWSHCKMLIEHSREIYWRKILTNINLISIVIGLVLFFFQIKLPSVVADTTELLGTMIAPCGMIITGMLIGGMTKEQFFGCKRAGLIVFLRLILLPIFCVMALKLIPAERISSIASNVLLIVMLASSSPQASTVVMMEQLYGENPQYASTLNVLSTVCCIITMPIMTLIWEL